MKTASVRDLRNNFARLSKWIEQGESVVITMHGKRFAELTPAKPEKPRKFKMPDFMARMKANFGDKVFTAEESQKMMDDLREERF